ncbi:MAG: 5-formyltetrahydrofolate cyclo-ligase [Chitinispirillales bacterium]|jgi:5-formyltetrahydrofolate cyclo-ligase|nr:5-formyltetrahydrofolate cyclo-ligase [Chitinispirillales bacterium]
MDGTKQNLRKHFISARKNLSADDAAEFSARIAQKIFSLPRISNSGLIMVYHKTGSEVDIGLLASLIIGSGRGAAFPYCRADGGLGIGRVSSISDDLTSGAFGIMEPADGLKDNVFVNQLDAVVCPGAAFDEAGGRLGRGGGYYDRFLRQIKGKAFIIGCAFDCQICKTPLPREDHDVVMDAVVTENRIFYGAGGDLC